MPPADVETEAALLDLNPLPNKHGVVIGYEGQKIEQIKNLVPRIVGDNGAYSSLSGSAHSEFWSLLGGYRGQEPSPLGLSGTQHEWGPESFIPLVHRFCPWAGDLQHLYELAPIVSFTFPRPLRSYGVGVHRGRCPTVCQR